MRRFLLTLAEFNRIHRVAHGTLRDVARVERACIFFACFGSMMLNKHFGIPARAVAGTFGLCLGGPESVLFFGDTQSGTMAASDEGFHMWVQTETHVIDFMSPIFAETFAEALPDASISRRMLQRPMTTETPTLDGLRAAGDFIVFPDLSLTERLIDSFLARPANRDLMEIAEAWHGPRRTSQRDSFLMINDLGEITELKLEAVAATGAW